MCIKESLPATPKKLFLPARIKGLLIAFLGVTSISTDDGLLLKFAASRGSNPWAAIGCLNLLCGFLMAAFTLLWSGGFGFFIAGIKAGPGHILLGALVNAAQSTALGLSLIYDSAAHALLFMSLSPLWAAILAHFTLHEKVPCRTYVALLCAPIIMSIVVLPPYFLEHHVDTETVNVGSPSAPGTAIASITGLLLASNFTVSRHASIHAPETDMKAAATIGILLSGMLGLAVACGHGLAFPVSKEFWSAITLDSVAKSIFCVCMVLAPTFISGVEAALVGLLEVILGPIWVFLGLGYVPRMWTFIGGCMFVVMLVVHELAAPDETAQQAKELDLEAVNSHRSTKHGSSREANMWRCTSRCGATLTTLNYPVKSTCIENSQLDLQPVVTEIHNARQYLKESSPHKLDTAGFQLVVQDTKVQNFDDLAEVQRVFYSEIEAMCKAQIPGCERCIVFDHKRRKGSQHATGDLKATDQDWSLRMHENAGAMQDSPVAQDSESQKDGYGGIHKPLTLVHGDYTMQDGFNRLRSLAMAPSWDKSTGCAPQLSPEEAEDIIANKRFMIVNAWRTVSRCHPVKVLPLAFLDCRTVDHKDTFDWAPPNGNFGVYDGFAEHPSNYVAGQLCVQANSNHRWFYFPDMTFTETALFKTFDSGAQAGRDTTFAQACFHTAFLHPDLQPEAPGRDSIEARMIIILADSQPGNNETCPRQ